MLTKRIVPCLDIRDGRVVKGIRFKDIRQVDDPVELARFYNDSGADELVFYDITASVEGRSIFTDLLRQVASQIFIPLTVGGAISSLADFDRVLKAGADKVSVNSGAIADPQLIAAAAEKYGAVLALYSAKIVEGSFNSSQERVYLPESNITRAELSAVIWRINNYYRENAAE